MAKGSQRYIQSLINSKKGQQIIEEKLKDELKLKKSIEWVSPLKKDGFKEYRDSLFLKKLGLGELSEKLKEFWPQGGAHWDALGKCGDKYFIVEAKAHISEQKIESTKSSAKSFQLIEKTLQHTKDFLNVKSDISWCKNNYYQYANRLAHLYFFRENNIEAHLLFIYFLNDGTIRPVKNKEEWQEAINIIHKKLGLLKEHNLKKFIHDIFIDVNDLL